MPELQRVAEVTRVPPPTYPILDSHCHAWRIWPYAPAVPDELSRGTVEQLLYEMDLHGVEQALVVCAGIENNPHNVQYVSFAQERWRNRIHVLADLDCIWHDTYHRPGSAARLRELVARYELVGVTHYVSGTNDGWLTSDEAEALFAVAEEQRLLISFAGGPVWQADLRALAMRHPTVPILCHHLGGVSMRASDNGEGMQALLASAACPNMYVKVSGFHYASAQGWNYPWTDVMPLFRGIYEAFGPHRLCWGSDFPASTRHCTYRQSLEVIRTQCDFLTQDDLKLIMGGTLQSILSARTRRGKGV